MHRPMSRPTARPAAGSLLARHGLGLATLLLVVTSALPARWDAAASWFASLATTVVAPVSHPFAAAARVLRPAASREEGRSLEVVAAEAERFKTLYHQANERSRRLSEQLALVSRGAAISPGVDVRQVPAVIVGESSGLPIARAGSRDGITPGAVATAGGVQLLGRAEAVEERTCRLRPITDRSVAPMAAVVMLDDAGERTLGCLLSPVGDGTLRGDAESTGPGQDPAGLRTGQTVRLRDPQWPEHAQMLVVGTVERIEPHADSPLRRVLTVRPTADLLRVAEVVLRVPDEPGEAP